jgi:hypothetical protein
MEIKAKVVFSKDEDFDFKGGPVGYEKVGIMVNDQVFWLSTVIWPGTTTEGFKKHQEKVSVAEEMVTRINQEPQEPSMIFNNLLYVGSFDSIDKLCRSGEVNTKSYSDRTQLMAIIMPEGQFPAVTFYNRKTGRWTNPEPLRG